MAEVANLKHDDHQPYVGDSAFAHKGGIHVAAVLKAQRQLPAHRPGTGRQRDAPVVSELSGRGNLIFQARARGIDLNREDAQRVLHEIKELEHQGLHLRGRRGLGGR